MKTQQQLQMLERIAAQEPDFVAWLESRMKGHQRVLVKQNDVVSVRWAQGKAQETQAILDSLSGASAELLATASQRNNQR